MWLIDQLKGLYRNLLQWEEPKPSAKRRRLPDEDISESPSKLPRLGVSSTRVLRPVVYQVPAARRSHLKTSMLKPDSCRRPSAWGSNAKENVVEVSDDECEEVVEVVGESRRELRQQPTSFPARKSIQHSESNNDDVELVKVVDRSREWAAARSSADSKTFTLHSRFRSMPQRMSSNLFKLSKGNGSCRNGHVGPLGHRRSALSESFRLDEKRTYSQLLQSYADSPCETPVAFNLFCKSRSGGTPLQEKVRKFVETSPSRRRKPNTVEVVDLTQPSQKVEVDTSFEARPYTAAMKKDHTKVLPEVVEVCDLSTGLPPSKLGTKVKVYNSETLLSDLTAKYDKRTYDNNQKIYRERLKAELRDKRHQEKLGEILAERLNRLASISSDLEPEQVTEEGVKTKLPELTSEMENEIAAALVPYPQTQPLVKMFGLEILRRDMATLAGLNWLNDEVINFYMSLLIERGKQDGYLKVYGFNTFFYPRLVSGGQAVLKRWTKKIDLFAHDMVLVPIHLGMHWCLAVIDFRTKTISYYDSMGNPNTRCLKLLLKYLEDEHLDKKKQRYDSTNWALENVEDIPQQMNGSDCGMFSCMYAEYISRGAAISFSQEDMPYFRRKMVYEILKGRLLL